MLRYVASQLDQHLASMPDLPDVAWANVEFTPDTTKVHLQVSYLPADGDLYSMDYAQETPGIYQVSVAAPVGSGPGTAQDTADDVRAHFAGQGKIGDVFIEAVNYGPAQLDDVWYVIPVSINWRYFDNG